MSSAYEAAAHHEIYDQYDYYDARHAHSSAAVVTTPIAIKSAAAEEQNQKYNNQQHRLLPSVRSVRVTSSLAVPLEIGARPISHDGLVKARGLAAD